MARRFWGDGDAVGRTFQVTFGESRTVRVIGVARDHRLFTVSERPAPYLHLAAAQRPSQYDYIVAHTSSDARQLLAAMRRELLTVEPGLVFIGSSTLEDSLAMSLLPQRVELAAGFCVLGTALAAIGLYGDIAFSVARRTREIGVRIAVGADTRNVLGLIIRQGLTLAVIGTIVGVVLGLLAARALSTILYGVGSFDLVAWSAAFAVLLASATTANLVPALSAIRIDPTRALRTE